MSSPYSIQSILNCEVWKGLSTHEDVNHMEAAATVMAKNVVIKL